MDSYKECKCRYKEIKRDQNEVDSLKRRIKKITGQLNGITKMLDDNRYCGDIIIQLSACEAALKSISNILFEEHIKTCVVSQIKDGHEEEVTNEIIKLIKDLK